MAAPTRLAMSVNQWSRILNGLCSRHVAAGIPLTQQVRHKHKTGRVRAPPQAKEKDKWVSRVKNVQVKEEKKGARYEEFLNRKPVDDVWMQNFYPQQKIPLDVAIQQHREYAVPEMLNNPEGYLYIHATVDMTTRKKTKFTPNFTKTILLPYYFEEKLDRRVLAFCKTEEDKTTALEMGAKYAGGIELIKDVERGEITAEDYDYVVCTSDMAQEITTIRKLLKENLPTRKNKNLGEPLEDMMALFVKGKTYQSSKVDDATGEVKFAFGRLSLSTEELLANWMTFLESLQSHSRVPKTGGNFVKKAELLCPPSEERFLIEDKWLQIGQFGMNEDHDEDVRETAAA